MSEAVQYTPDLLLEMAIAFESQGYEGRRQAQDALLCARYMEQKGIVSAPQIGPFGPTNFVKGEKVRVKLGSTIRKPTHPNMGDGPSKRRYNIEIFSVLRGYVYEEHDCIKCYNTEVCWPGTGGYWFYTEATNVERVQ